MLTVTPSAARHLARVRASGFGTRSPRLIGVEGVVELTFTDVPVFDDESVDTGVITLLVESGIACRLEEATIDVRRDGDRETLVILDGVVG